MFGFDDLPNELYLIVFCYLTKDELIESFYQLNQRINSILLKYFSRIFLQTKLTRKQIEQYQQIDAFIQNLTIENYQIGKEFICEKISLKNLSRIQFIDSALELYENVIERIQPEIIAFVSTCFCQNQRKFDFQSKSIQKFQFEFLSNDFATKYDD